MGERVRIALVCDECTERNYHTTKSRKNQRGERLTIKKFCPRCNKHTMHSESK